MPWASARFQAASLRASCEDAFDPVLRPVAQPPRTTLAMTSEQITIPIPSCISYPLLDIDAPPEVPNYCEFSSSTTPARRRISIRYPAACISLPGCLITRSYWEILVDIGSGIGSAMTGKFSGIADSSRYCTSTLAATNHIRCQQVTLGFQLNQCLATPA